jgi:hydrocephalus-inducing protein
MKFGRTKTVVPLEIKNGARYNIELISNITFPELRMENVEGDLIDFK